MKGVNDFEQVVVLHWSIAGVVVPNYNEDDTHHPGDIERGKTLAW